MTDVLIAGGGPAGASLAILLGRAGFSVELHDRAVFPREKACGEGMMPAGAAALSRLGVKVNGAPFHGIRYYFGPQMVEGRFPETPGLPRFGFGIRRLHLDRSLFHLAAETGGVRAFENSVVEAAVSRNGMVCGAKVNGQDHHCRLLVAADGVHSRLRRQAGLDGPTGERRAGLRAHFRLAAGVTPPEFVEVYWGQGHELYVTPLPEGELQVALLTWRGSSSAISRTSLTQAIAADPRLSALLRRAAQVSRTQGISPLSGTARARVLPGFVLLGDAAGFIDPITGGGMTQALLTSELLARRLTAYPEPSLDSLLAYDEARQKLLADYRRLTAIVLGTARYESLFALALRLLRGCPPLFSHAIAVSGGMRRLLPGVLP